MIPADEHVLPRIGPAYGELRGRVTDLVTAAVAADPAAGDRPVPACPAWRVHDVVAHLTGACEDILAGNLEGVASDPWTDAQVQRHADTPLPAVLDRWNEVAPQVEAITPHFPHLAAAQWVFDGVTHEHDLRGALGEPGARDSDAVQIGVGFLLTSLAGLVERASLPAVAVELPGGTWTSDDRPAELVLSGSDFDVLRSLGGRRTADEVQALAVTGDPTPMLALFASGPLHVRAEPLGE